MISAAAVIRDEIRARLRSWLATSIGFFVGFHAFQLAVLVVRFETFPNYLTVHDWPGNIARIARMTPSISDMIPIMLDEWLIETGSINYAFGRGGIAEWSFVLIPAKAAVVLVISVLLATNLVLLCAASRTCGLFERLGAAAAAGSGALISGAAVTTITWVVCCAAPTWVVGLSVMGVGVATALALQPFGTWLTSVGLLALAATAIMLARRSAGRPARNATSPVMGLSTQIVGAPS
jgi:hypothetical protein